MSEEDGDYGSRESPMARNGGLKTGTEGRYYRVEYSHQERGILGRNGRKYAHPPLSCPDPRTLANLRGLYSCPACGMKVPLYGHCTPRDLGYSAADWAGSAVVAALGSIPDLLRSLPRGAEVAIGLVLVCAPVLAYLSVNGLLPR